MQAQACACTFNTCKTSKLVCVHSTACDFGMHMWASEYTHATRDARHELTLGLPQYMCGVTTGTVAVGNEIQLYCS